MSDASADPQALEQQALRWLEGMPTFYRDMVKRSNLVTNRDILVHYRTYRGALYLMFDSVPSELRPSAAMGSALCIIIACYLDYYADTVPRVDLMEEARAHVLDGHPIVSSELAQLPEMWKAYLNAISNGPNFIDFRTTLLEQWDALFEAKLHSIRINTNPDERNDYRTAMAKFTGNMLGGHKHVLDMMHSPGWDPAWTSTALDLAWRMAAVVRIGNCLKSWRQEISLHRDISSTVCATAIEHGVVDWFQLKRGDPSVSIQRIEETRISALGDRTSIEHLQHEQAKMLDAMEAMGRVAFTDLARYVGALRTVVADQMKGSAERR